MATEKHVIELERVVARILAEIKRDASLEARRRTPSYPDELAAAVSASP